MCFINSRDDVILLKKKKNGPGRKLLQVQSGCMLKMYQNVMIYLILLSITIFSHIPIYSGKNSYTHLCLTIFA